MYFDAYATLLQNLYSKQIRWGNKNISKVPQESKLSFLICENKELVTIRNRIKYFVKNWNDSCMSVFVGVQKYLTKSAIPERQGPF